MIKENLKEITKQTSIMFDVKDLKLDKMSDVFVRSNNESQLQKIMKLFISV
jgi:hypothetical protein